jgi:hypothetical protein
VRIAGLDGQLLATDKLSILGRARHDYMDSFGDTIGGGANEITRNLSQSGDWACLAKPRKQPSLVSASAKSQENS